MKLSNNTINTGKSSYFHDEDYWSGAWINHIENYLKSPPRCGYWLESNFKNCDTTLEIAAGSCHDSLYLAKTGKNAIGSDFDQKTLEYLKSRHPQASLKLQKEDGFSLSLPDNSIDLVFSNGFFVLFSENEDIYSLIREQARVAKKFIVALNHNGTNPRLRKLFKKKSIDDDLYKIRFFSPKEIEDIIKNSGVEYKSISLKKFGGPLDRLYLDRFFSFKNPIKSIAKKITPYTYDIQPWSVTERIACVIELP